MKKVLASVAALAMLVIPGFAWAADTDDTSFTPEHPMHLNIAADARIDFNHDDYHGGDKKSGFYGRYLNLMINGEINEHFSFAFRQRLNKFKDLGNDVFSATDWIYLNYSPTELLTLSAGKQVVAIGGYEYDRAPINIYYASMFWYNIGCYQFGASATLHFDQGRHNLLAQVCNSPYQAIGQNCFAYNLMWIGTMGCFETLYSTNLIEYQKDIYGNIISLGNKLNFGNVYAEIDFMNRYWGSGRFLFDDFSLIGKVCATAGKFDVFAKGGYEHFAVIPGSRHTVDKPFYGVGVEFYPIKGSRNLRVHAVADITHDATTGQRCTQIGCGLMWRVTLLNKNLKK